METELSEVAPVEIEKRDVPKKLIDFEGLDVDDKTMSLISACVKRMESMYYLFLFALV